MADGFVVTAVGGGGIPVTRDAAGDLHGVEAVIDKDLASALLARLLGADLFVISTNVPQVCLHFGKPDQRALGRVTADEATRYLAAGHFGAGSMAPKIQGTWRTPWRATPAQRSSRRNPVAHGFSRVDGRKHDGQRESVLELAANRIQMYDTIHTDW